MPTSWSSCSQARLPALDGLRGIAAVMVLLYHYFYQYERLYGHAPSVFVHWSQWGQYGVELFFIISGVVILMTLERCPSSVHFIYARFTRLYPTYWCCIALTWGTVSVLGLPEREVDFFTALINGLMFHSWFDVPHVDGVYWTLQVELQFYLLMGLIFSCGQLKRIQTWAALALLLLLGEEINLYDLPAGIIDALLGEHLPFFALGIALWLERKAQRGALLLALLALGCALIERPLGEQVLFVVLALLVRLALRPQPPAWLSTCGLLWLGALSYPLYLLHQNIGYALLRQGYAMEWSPALSVPLVSLLALTLAWCVHHHVEQPVQHWLRSSFRRKFE